MKIYEDNLNKQITAMILASSSPDAAQDPAARATYRKRIEGDVLENSYYDKTSGAFITLTRNADLLSNAFTQATDELESFYGKIHEGAGAALLRVFRQMVQQRDCGAVKRRKIIECRRRGLSFPRELVWNRL